jgi:uncharacterized membrane protein required for colicin V production
MNAWNGLDFFIFLIFAANTILGMSRGASREIISMMCLSVALIFTIKFTVPLALLLNKSSLIVDVVDSSFTKNLMLAIGAGPLTQDALMEVMYCISMLLCFVGIFSICEAALTKAGVNESFSFPYATLSRKIGAVLGCTRGYILALMLLSILSLHLLKNGQPGGDIVSGSYFAGLLRSSTVSFDAIITSRNPDYYNKLFEGKDAYTAADVIKQLNTSGNLQPSVNGASIDILPQKNDTQNGAKSGAAPASAPASSKSLAPMSSPGRIGNIYQ